MLNKEGKTSLCLLTVLCLMQLRIPLAPLWQGQIAAHISLVFSFAAYTLREPLLVTFGILPKLSSRWALDFCNVSLRAKTVSLHSSQVTSLSFYLLHTSFSCLSFARSSLIIMHFA